MNLSENVNVFQILLRLPVRSLLRFRCVSKEWCTLINSCVFKDTYLALRRAMAVDDQLVGLKTTLVSDIPYEDMTRVIPYADIVSEIPDEDADRVLGLDYNDDKVRTLLNDLCRGIYSISITCWSGDCKSLALSALAPSSSCNDLEISGNCSGWIGMIRIINHVHGIVCFINGYNWFDITLVNPALREIRKLPIPVFDLGGFKRQAQGIGFGYDDSNNEYKVVAIVTVFEEDVYNSPYKHIGIVYHLRTNSWTILGDMSQFLSSPFECFPHLDSVFSHGSLHWCIQSVYDEPQTKYRILAFDVSNELFREIPFPHGYRYYAPYERDVSYPHLFTVDKSTIALVASTNMTYDVQVLEVWMMKEYGGDSDSWTKMYSISNLPGFIEAISFWKKDKLLLASVGAELICYDLFKGQLDEHEQCYRISISGIRGFGLVTGHQSFVSVKLQA